MFLHHDECLMNLTSKKIKRMFWKKKNKEKLTSSMAIGNINVVIKTDLGNVRTNNEDSASFFRIADQQILRDRGYLLIVADGMGGHLAGEVASKMAVDVISEEYYKPSNATIADALKKAFNKANKKIFDVAATHEQYRGMGTTATAVVILGTSIYFAHAGDSRAYLLKNKTVTRITEDHTYVQELVNQGNITAAEAETHPQRNILTNAMGTKPELRVDAGIHPMPFEQNDRVLLCSDGLYDYLSDDEIAQAMAQQFIKDAAEYFIAEAKQRGGMDNITVVLAETENNVAENTLKTTREVLLPKETRDADLPENITNL